jgi:hypothetical protein
VFSVGVFCRVGFRLGYNDGKFAIIIQKADNLVGGIGKKYGVESQSFNELQPVPMVAAVVSLDVFAGARRIDFLFRSAKAVGGAPVALEFIWLDEKAGQAASKLLFFNGA